LCSGVSERINDRVATLKAEQFCYALRKIVLSRRGVDIDRRQSKTRRFLTEDLGEHPVALKQIV
jgi:hypothetical protein